MKQIAILASLVLLSAATLGCSARQEPAEQVAETTAEPHADAESAVVTDDSGTRVTLSVTREGFVPASVTVPAGKPVTLIVTRRTDKTCATDLVLKEHQIHQPLPLDQAVQITFTPESPGELTYGCAMNMMIQGKIVVQ